MTPAHPHDDIGLLFSLLPLPLQHALSLLPREQLLEIVLDLGRVPQARLRDGAVMLGVHRLAGHRIDLDVRRTIPIGLASSKTIGARVIQEHPSSRMSD